MVAFCSILPIKQPVPSMSVQVKLHCYCRSNKVGPLPGASCVVPLQIHCKIGGYDHTAVTMRAPTSMRWSPTGEWIAYTAAVSTSVEVFLIRPDGGERVRLTQDTRWDRFVHSWSPDGREVFVWAEDSEGRQELYGLDIHTFRRQTVIRYPEPLPSWEDLFVVDIRSGQPIPVRAPSGPEAANLVIVVPSPDFRYYAIWTAEDWFEGWWGSRLYILDTYTQEVRSSKHKGSFSMIWTGRRPAVR